jgi:glycyl-tRNA synthetase
MKILICHHFYQFPTFSTVTLRERDSMKQVRIPIDDVAGVVRDLAHNRLLWSDVEGKYPIFEQQESSTK